MDPIKTPPVATSQPKLDFAGLLGFSQVFIADGDLRLQAELIEANCNKMGGEGCCET